MIDKLKSILAVIKQVILWVLAPLLGILAYIYYLTTKISNLTNQLEQTKVEKELSQTLDKKIEADHEATQTELDYNTVRKLFLNQSGKGPDDSGPGPKSAA